MGAIGARAGLALGVLDGLLLGAPTRAFYQPWLADAGRYRKAAGRTCVAASASALATYWVLMSSENRASYENVPSSLDFVLFAIFPSLVASCSMWFSGRKVAGQYARKAGRPQRGGQPPTAGGYPAAY